MKPKITLTIPPGTDATGINSVRDVKDGILRLPVGVTTRELKSMRHGEVFNRQTQSFVALNPDEFEAELMIQENRARNYNQWILEDVATCTTFRMYSRYFLDMMVQRPISLREPISGIWGFSIHGSKFGLKLVKAL